MIDNDLRLSNTQGEEGVSLSSQILIVRRDPGIADLHSNHEAHGRDQAGAPVPEGMVHHSDAGSQYTSIRFGEALLLEGLAASVGSVGDAYDNALAESTIGLYKNECVRKNSPFMTGPLKQLADVEKATMSWVHWYSTTRLHSTLGMVPPDEFEQNYYAQIDASSDNEATSKKTA